MQSFASSMQGVDASPPAAERHRRAFLTRRETEVLGYLPTRLSNADIARRLGVTKNTVKTHLKDLYRKLGVHTRDQAIEAALAKDLLVSGPPGPRETRDDVGARTGSPATGGSGAADPAAT